VADTGLGGISATITAYEALISRGYDIAAVVGCQSGQQSDVSSSTSGSPARNSDSAPVTGQGVELDNMQYLDGYICHTPSRPPAKLFRLPACPAAPPNDREFSNSKLQLWFKEAQCTLQDLAEHLNNWHSQRLARLKGMKHSASEVLWWPFTQHATLASSEVTLIDARDGENFSTCTSPSDQTNDKQHVGDSGPVCVQTLYDGCASWWTQGVSADLQPLARQHLAYGAGRYGHVIFPEAVHEPALRLSEKLLETVGRGWAHRVFFSDDG
jgi:bifunctional dethiobiotin synthetase / adenosylmethionine---8-amino-7-oxononanoate aminotransferase